MTLPSDCATIILDGSTSTGMIENSFETYSSLAVDDDEFIRMADTIILRLKKLKRDKYPSWFERNFKNTRIGRKRREKRRLKDAEADYGVITSDDLVDFQHALFLRLEDQENDQTLSVFVDAVDVYPISYYMHEVLRLVEIVGWPSPDDIDEINLNLGDNRREANNQDGVPTHV